MATFPPTHGPPPNFRLPPPGAAPYMAPGYVFLINYYFLLRNLFRSYPVPPRPMFDTTRPPLTGLPPGFAPNYPPGSRPPHQSRDYSNRRIRERTPPG